MKKYTLFIILAIAAISFSSCSSKRSPIKTFVMPCSECVKSKDAIRVWASGTSEQSYRSIQQSLQRYLRQRMLLPELQAVQHPEV